MPNSGGKSTWSCISSGVRKSAARGCKLANITARWIPGMISWISIMGTDRIHANRARFSNSRGLIWLFIDGSRWYNDFGNSRAMLQAFPDDRATRIFRMTSLALIECYWLLMIMCAAILVGAGRCHVLLWPSVNFSGADGTEYWVLVDWSRTWINFDVAG